MSGQKQNLLWLMIICCVLRQITCSDELIIQVNSSDQCFWNQSNSTIPDIKCTCLTADEPTGTFQLNISTLGECRSYNLSIKQDKNYEIRMNEMIPGIKLWILPNGSNYQFSVQNSSVIKACQAQDGILSISARIGFQNIDPVDPEEKCKNALYNNDICSGKEGNRYILHLNESEWICVTCDDGRSTTISPSSNTISYNSSTIFTSHMTTPDPTTSFTSHMTIDKPISTVKPPEITSKVSKILENIESLLEQMEKENKTNTPIDLGDVIGLLLRQPIGTETNDIDICYSSHRNIMTLVESNQKTEFPWCVKIPNEAFNESRLENNGSAFVYCCIRGITIAEFASNASCVSWDEKGELNWSMFGCEIELFDTPLGMFYSVVMVASNASCISWDEKGELNWTTFGCEIELFDTFVGMPYSVVMNPYPPSDGKDQAPHQESLTFISSIGCGFSIFFLADALFIHFVLRKAKSNQATKILMNMFVALCLLNILFLSNESVANTGDNAACVFIALLLHYSMLASFTWFFIQALHMYLWLIRQNVSITNYMRKITVLGWVCPAPVVTVIVSVGGYKAVILNTTSEKITRMCWISNFYIHYIVNISFYALVFIFIMIIIAAVQTRKIKATEDKRKTFRKQLMMVLSLFLLFGLTWSLPFFSYGPMLITSYYIFTVLNLFQGIFLFVYYYHIRNDAEGHFSNDPESTSSTRNIT